MKFILQSSRVSAIRQSLAALLLLTAAAPLPAAEPSPEPLLRVETGMHTTRIFRLATDAQQRYLATVSDDKTLRVWDLRTGTLLATLRPPIDTGNEGKLHGVAMSPDGEHIAIGGWTGQLWDKSNSIYIFHRSSGRLIKRITELPETIANLAYSPDGRFLAATTLGKTGVHVYRTDDFRLVGRDSEYGDAAYSAHFSRDQRLVTGSDDGYVRLYQVSNLGLRLVAKQQLTQGREAAIARFSPDGRKIAVGVYDLARIEVLDGHSLNLLYTPDITGLTSGNLIAVSWSADGNMLYAGGTAKIDGRHPFRRWTGPGAGPISIISCRPIPCSTACRWPTAASPMPRPIRPGACWMAPAASDCTSPPRPRTCAWGAISSGYRTTAAVSASCRAPAAGRRPCSMSAPASSGSARTTPNCKRRAPRIPTSSSKTGNTTCARCSTARR